MGTAQMTTLPETSTCLAGVQSWDLPYRHDVQLVAGRKGRSLVCRTWQPYRISIQGVVGQGYQLLVSGSANVTKRGEIGRFKGEVANGGSASEALYRAHRAWVAAGKPETFTWTD